MRFHTHDLINSFYDICITYSSQHLTELLLRSHVNTDGFIPGMGKLFRTRPHSSNSFSEGTLKIN